jgi:hypothetical protein
MAVTITRTAWIDDDGSGTTGTVINNAVKTELYNQIDEGFGKLAVGGQGVPIAHPFNAADYTATAPLVWAPTAGEIATNVYSVVGKQLFWLVQIASSTTGAAGPEVQVRLPGGFVYSYPVVGSSSYANVGGSLAPLFITGSGAGRVGLSHADGAAINVGPLYVYFAITLWIT